MIRNFKTICIKIMTLPDNLYKNKSVRDSVV